MRQNERLYFLLDYLIKESSNYSSIEIPTDVSKRKYLLRSLMNVRMPEPVSDDFLKIQDEYLRCEIEERGITDISKL